VLRRSRSAHDLRIGSLLDLPPAGETVDDTQPEAARILVGLPEDGQVVRIVVGDLELAPLADPPIGRGFHYNG
jgi:hypothetical protein